MNGWILKIFSFFNYNLFSNKKKNKKKIKKKKKKKKRKKEKIIFIKLLKQIQCAI
jgi:hypothetical protein